MSAEVGQVGEPDPRKVVLFIGPLPEPVTGQSVACQVLVRELTKHYEVDVVNLSKRDLTQPRTSAGRILDVLRILFSVWRRKGSASLVYLTVSQSYFGNIKDLLIYLVCFRRLDRMVIHLYGGAGLRGIMLRSSHPLRKPNEFFMRRLAGAIVEGPRQLPTFANGPRAERVHVVANFAEDELFSDAASVARKFERTRPLRVLFLSNLLPGKGHQELVEAMKALKDRAGIRLDIAGGAETDGERVDFLRRIKGIRNIKYHGPVRGADRKALFHQAHVLCLATYYAYEGQPLSILEAYASGCAVITTDHSGIRDVFADGVNGYEVVARSVAVVTSTLERAAAEPERVKAMALANLAAAESQYRAEHYRRRMVPILDAVVRRADSHA